MSTNTRNQGLDLLRFLAILSVLCLHAEMISPEMPAPLKYIFRFGWCGVDLFFVLSGFLIGRQVFESPDSGKFDGLRIFWIKRWFRTFPLYFLMLLVYVVLKPALGYPFRGWDLSFLYFFQNYLPPIDFVQSWSLCIEEQFYLVFPILAFVLGVRKWPSIVWLIPMLVSIFYRYLHWKSGALAEMNEITLSEDIRFPFHTHLDGISVGVYLGALFPLWEKMEKQKKLGFLALGLVTIIGTFMVTGPDLFGVSVIFSYAVLSIGFGCLVIGCYETRIPDFLLTPVTKVALWSYGLYLWNNLVMKIVEKYLGGSAWGVQFLVFLVISLILAAATYSVVEEPFLKLRNQLLRTRRGKFV